MSDELRLIAQNLLKLFDIALDGLGEQFEVLEAQRTVIELTLNQSNQLLSCHVSVLSFDDVFVNAVVYVVKYFVSSLGLVKNHFEFGAP